MDTLFAVVWSDESADPDATSPDPVELRSAISRVLDRPLADLGVTRYVVNVRDAEVAGALIDVRTTPAALRAAVRVRVPVASATACRPVLDALGALGPVSAWSVTHSEPLPVTGPDSTAPVPETGLRIDGMANLAFLRRPERIDRLEWLRIWLEDHTQVAIDTQSTTAYTQHVVVRALTDDAPGIDGIVEEVFPIGAVRDPGVFFDARGDDARLRANTAAMAASTGRFLDDGAVDAIPTGRYVMSVRAAHV